MAAKRKKQTKSYHTKPLLQVRVPQETIRRLEWIAKRLETTKSVMVQAIVDGAFEGELELDELMEQCNKKKTSSGS